MSEKPEHYKQPDVIALPTHPYRDTAETSVKSAEQIISDGYATAQLIGAIDDMLVALCKMVCPECNHELQHHIDKYGCEIERGDGYRNSGEFEEALGPCGCNDDDLRDDYSDFVRAIEALRKAKGKQ